MNTIQLGQSDLHVTPICLGTMTFGEQVDEASAHAILNRSLERGVNFIDTAEMYAVPARAETCGATETIIGNWFAKNPGVAPEGGAGHQGRGPFARHALDPRRRWDDGGRHRGLVRRQPAPAADRCDRPVPDPLARAPRAGLRHRLLRPVQGKSETLHPTSSCEALAGLVKAGKVRHIGLSNETPYGVHEFVRLAEQHGLPRVASIQNPYCLINRTFENGWTRPATDWACRCWPTRRWASAC
jgi:aryl-alcohol dehydrogenase-like predicted oxidoreductase